MVNADPVGYRWGDNPSKKMAQMATASTLFPYSVHAVIKMIAADFCSKLAANDRRSTKTVATSSQFKVRASCDFNSAGGILHFDRNLIAMSKMIAKRKKFW